MADTDDGGFPRGPWVLVLGMHRSGTSALAGALGRLGLSLPAPDDLVSGRYDNPVHNESRALNDVDDAMLEVLGGTWSAPPRLSPGWARSPALAEMTGRAGKAAARAFPRPGPLVWKDPRLCLLLPWWREALPPPIITVYLWRAPLSVARSLRSRQGFSPSLGLALWDRYNRDALTALAGHEVYILRYEELLRDPRTSVHAVARWIQAGGRVPMIVDDARLAEAASTVSAKLARQEGAGELPPVVDSAVATLTRLDGINEPLDRVDISEAPPWMADVIAQRRDYEEIYARYMRYVRWRRRIPFLGRRARAGDDP
jgi:hypothetical protein